MLLSAGFKTKFGLVFVLTYWKKVFLRRFILKPAERAQVLLKNGPRDFQNSPPFERLACFYVTIAGNFEHFQYLTLKQIFWKRKTFFQKTGVLFFS